MEKRRMKVFNPFRAVVLLLAGVGFVLPFTSPARGQAASPSGDIAFVSNRDGGYDIYSINVQSLATTRITKDGTFKQELTWSPDGKTIAYDSNKSVNWEIYTLDVATGTETE